LRFLDTPLAADSTAAGIQLRALAAALGRSGDGSADAGAELPDWLTEILLEESSTLCEVDGVQWRELQAPDLS